MRRHNFDPISFVFGALFAAIGLTFLFGDADIGDLHIAVVWPLPLIVIGILMLVSTIQRRNREAPAPAVASQAIRDERSEPRPQPASTPTPKRSCRTRSRPRRSVRSSTWRASSARGFRCGTSGTTSATRTCSS